MSGCIIPEGYTPRLNVYETQRAIEFIKRSFQKNLGSALNLKRVSATSGTGKRSSARRIAISTISRTPCGAS